MKSEFLESELELYVQRLLVHESYATGNQYKMFKISPKDERLKGYDAEVVGLTPFYCQFKTSDFLTRGGFFKQRQEYCEKKKWPKAPFYTFPLRVPNDAEDKKHPNKWQHNVLHALWKSNQSAVAYVAPVFHTRAELDLYEPFPVWRGCIWSSDSNEPVVSKRSGISIKTIAMNGKEICRLPFFDGLISIPPHAPVTELKHSYCFNSPSDVSFHSEPTHVEAASTFHERLRSFVQQSVQRDLQDNSDKRMRAADVRELTGIDEKDADFLESFLGFGLLLAGFSSQRSNESATKHFENEASWLQQRLAFSGALKAYFGITTLGLIEFKEV